MDFVIAHDFDCDADRYWRIFFDEEFNVALYRELEVHERRLLDRREEEGGEVVHRAVRIVPKTDADVMSLLKKLVSGEIAYIERSVFRKSKSAFDVTVELDVPGMAKRFDFRGVYSVVPLGEKSVRREFRATIKVGVPLFGGQIERKVAEMIRRNHEIGTTFTRRWLSEHA